MSRAVLIGLTLISGALLGATSAGEKGLADLLNREVFGPRQTLSDVQKYLESRVPEMPKVSSAAAWEKTAERLREEILTQIVYRGEAKKWRDAKTKVEWLETLPGGPGYRLKKLRFEALPGMWIPALLYEPEKLTGKVPATLNVMGHDGGGKEVAYQQIRCINLVKRGMLALNVEWFNFGQLRTDNYRHGRMNQLDLCGTSGLAPFYLSLKRGLDVLLAHEHADPERVAVSGLSGGGWQTIWISALDTRVKLANPVAGYSGFRTRIRHLKDLGDSEQTPCDMATVADYTHLTALLAPRAALLTYNSKDECCFESGYALPPLLDAATPIYRLLGKKGALQSHVNHDPGTHNYELDNRQAFYRMIRDHFYPGDSKFPIEEIPCGKEVRAKQELAVPMPKSNEDFNTLALALSKGLPRVTEMPMEKRRAALADVVKAKTWTTKAVRVGAADAAGTQATYWRLDMGDAWQVPVVELVRGKPKATVILVHDGGRRQAVKDAERLLATGNRVLAVDPFYFGEAKIAERDYLFALLVSAVGERPLGIQASQLIAVARWSATDLKSGPVTLDAIGPRTSVIALVATGLETGAIAGLATLDTPKSLRDVIVQNRSFEQMPELFCFGLLERFDIEQMDELASRPKR